MKYPKKLSLIAAVVLSMVSMTPAAHAMNLNIMNKVLGDYFEKCRTTGNCTPKPGTNPKNPGTVPGRNGVHGGGNKGDDIIRGGGSLGGGDSEPKPDLTDSAASSG